jgi:peptidoglycan/LPS O-acetylase OafA/YrhL
VTNTPGTDAAELHSAPERLAFVELLRALAATAIVLHHLAWYGPLPELAQHAAPAVIDWLCEYARMAVHAFVAIAGFGAARRVLRRPFPLRMKDVLTELSRRYQRIVLPFLVAVGFALLCNEFARGWMNHPMISARPSFWQLVAHASLLTDILDFEPLTAGAWYVAMDFQLLAVTLLSAWVASRPGAGRVCQAQSQRYFAALCSTLGAVSLLFFSRRPECDEWAIYFFGSYFLGMAIEFRRKGVVSPGFVVVQCIVVGLALAVEFRGRLLIAAITAGLVLLATRKRSVGAWPNSRLILGLGRVSYSLFLVHFPVCLLMNALGSRMFTTPLWAAVGLCTAFVASVAVAVPFHRFVEQRCRGGAATSSLSAVRDIVFRTHLSTSNSS